MSEDRLFVPVMSRFFDQFANGTKTWEIRRAVKQWRPLFVYPGRRVEIRRGYSGGSFFGTIGKVVLANSVTALFHQVPAQQAAPTEFNDDGSSRALTMIEFWGIDSTINDENNPIDLIAFEVLLNTHGGA